MKRVVFIIVPLLLIGVAVYWFATHAYLSISVNSSQPGDASINLVNQSTGGTNTLTVSSGQVRRLVRRGSYEVLATQGEQHAFAISKVGGFLGNSKLHLSVEPENRREFVGNEPLPCTGMAGNVLFSLACGDTVSNIQLHIPASSTLPTHTKKLSTPLRGFAEGTVQTSEGSLVIVKAPNNSEDQGPPHAVYSITVNGLVFLSPLSSLDASAYYNAALYKTGFLVYNIAKGEIFYFSSAKAKPEIIRSPNIEDNELKFYSLGVYGEQLAITFSTVAGEEPSDAILGTGNIIHSEQVEKLEAKNPRSQVVVLTGQNQQIYSFDFTPLRVRLCAQAVLCVLKDTGELLVYEIGGSDPKFLYKLRGVQSIHSLGDVFVAVRKQEVVKLEVANRRGTVLYSFGDYRYCGLQPAASQTLICVVNSKNKRSVLALPQTSNTDSIDKKVSELLKNEFVKDVSAYGNFIFVSPELGELSFQQSLGGFGYDPALKNQTAGKIDEVVKRIGFGANYSVINLYR